MRLSSVLSSAISDLFLRGGTRDRNATLFHGARVCLISKNDLLPARDAKSKEALKCKAFNNFFAEDKKHSENDKNLLADGKSLSAEQAKVRMKNCVELFVYDLGTAQVKISKPQARRIVEALKLIRDEAEAHSAKAEESLNNFKAGVPKDGELCFLNYDALRTSAGVFDADLENLLGRGVVALRRVGFRTDVNKLRKLLELPKSSEQAESVICEVKQTLPRRDFDEKFNFLESKRNEALNQSPTIGTKTTVAEEQVSPKGEAPMPPIKPRSPLSVFS